MQIKDRPERERHIMTRQTAGQTECNFLIESSIFKASLPFLPSSKLSIIVVAEPTQKSLRFKDFAI